MEDLVRTLETGNHSLVVRNGDVRRTFDGRGVSDLYRLLHEEPEILDGAEAADKVVGKGAAALMAAAHVSAVYAGIISRPALELLAKAGISTTYGMLVDGIVNRAGTGPCPLEALCMDCHTPEECLPRIDSFIAEMRQKVNVHVPSTES